MLPSNLFVSDEARSNRGAPLLMASTRTASSEVEVSVRTSIADQVVPPRGNLPGPSRRIVVEPIEAPVEPPRLPAEPPAEPLVRPDDEPVPAR